MAAPSRNKDERERDREEIARRLLRGETQAAVARDLGVSRSQVGYDLDVLRRRWVQDSLTAFDARVAIELAKLEELERTCWEAWERSRGAFSRTTTRSRQNVSRSGTQGEATVERHERDGDPRFLEGILKCIDRRIRLVGADAPIRIDLEHELRIAAADAGLDPDQVVAAATYLLESTP